MKTRQKKKPPKPSKRLKQDNSPLKIPSYLDETEVLAVMEKVLNQLAPGFTFGYFDVDDVKSVIREKAIRKLNKYDRTRPLDSFLFVTIKNLLINFKRDNFKRNDPPCVPCHLAWKDGLKTNHPDGGFCDKYKSWADRNNARQNVMQPINLNKQFFTKQGMENQEPETGVDYSPELITQAKELEEKIDLNLPIFLRETYLRMKLGYKVDNRERERVKEAIRSILGMEDGQDEIN